MMIMMKRSLKTVLGAAALTAATTVSAMAATLSVVGTGASVQLDSDFNPAPTVAGIGDGDFVTNFSGTTLTGGLSLDTAALLQITFLGKEAAFTNVAFETVDGQTLSNNVEAGVSIFFTAAAGLVTFGFTSITGGGTITNGVSATSTTLDLAFKRINDQSFYVLFGDGAGDDDDYDDWVGRIDVVPLPAGGVLLLTALGGIAALRRRKAA
jgi:hypothetical protein